MAAAMSSKTCAVVATGAFPSTFTANRGLKGEYASGAACGRRMRRSECVHMCSSLTNATLWNLPQRRAAVSEARNGAVAAGFHTSGGGVDRNDAAPTGPLLKPDPKILLEEAVRLQMDALARSDEPRPDHGLEVMYGFAITDGTESGSTLSKYFGFPSDLYHFGHFALKFKHRYPELINHAGYELLKTETEHQGDQASIAVRAKNRNNNDSCWTFFMSKFSRGLQEPCWVTASLQRCTG